MGTAVLLAAGAAVATVLPAQAATGCRVIYTISSQWPGGFGENVKHGRPDQVRR